jgi:glycosyltransferase involved in cell wall biosynthesis
MKIAILAPSPVPFVLGGAENLWAGLLQAFNRQPDIECDLIKLPSPERTLAEIFDSYHRFASLDLRHFDLVISTKYPAWAVHHPKHIVYLQHKLRGLYDTYPSQLPSLIDEPDLARSGLPVTIVRALQGGPADGLDMVDTAHALRTAHAHHGADPVWSFPGPLARACVHLLDRIAMAPGRIARYAAISHTVAARPDYFPAGVAVDVMHHPSSLVLTQAQPAQAIFSASRLDAAKRIDLIIDAYLQAELTIPLRIAGSGPALQSLQQRAAGHPGIHFLGRLTDAELAGEYARALFVPFVPLQEDYGLITVEAMASGKAVLTTSDAGGVTELVESGRNGLIVDPDASALARAMQQLVADFQITAAMGEAARERVAGIRWQDLVDFLMYTPAAPAILSKARPRYTVINTFPITPTVSGGQMRLMGLYRHLANDADIKFINLGGARSLHHVRALAAGFTEEVVPRTPQFIQAQLDLEKVVNASCGDLAAALYPRLLPQWVSAIAHAVKGADAVICSHPYGHAALEASGYQGKLFYEGHNNEFDLKQSIYQGALWPLEKIREIEGRCIAAAHGATVCSEEEATRLVTLYGADPQRIAVVPNGVDAGRMRFQSAAMRAYNQLRYQVRRPIALFIGSAHQPNVDAAAWVLREATQCPDIDFVLIGSVCQRFAVDILPANVRLLGLLAEDEKMRWLSLADIGLNPILSGAGTNLKLAEYAALGLPIVSTRFGARGGVLQEGVHYVAAAPEHLAEALHEVLAMPMLSRHEMIVAANLRVRQTLDWQAIAKDYAVFLTS